MVGHEVNGITFSEASDSYEDPFKKTIHAYVKRRFW
jgi:hypothetical protein